MPDLIRIGPSGGTWRVVPTTGQVYYDPSTGTFPEGSATDVGLSAVVQDAAGRLALASAAAQVVRPSAAFDPASLYGAGDDGCYLRSDSLSALSPGAPVTSWTDLSGKGRHAEWAVPGECPSYQAGGGLAWVRGNGTNSRLRTAPFPVVGAGGAYTTIAVARFLGGSNPVLVSADQFGSRVAQFLRLSGSATQTIPFNTAGTPFILSNTSGISPATVFLLIAQSNGAEASIRVGADTPVTAATPGTPKTGTQTLQLFSNRTGAGGAHNEFTNSDIFGLCHITRVLSADDIAAVAADLMPLGGLG